MAKFTPDQFVAYIDKSLVKSEEELQEVLDKAAAVCEAEAKQDCPVDTGNLRGSIHTEKGHLENIVGTDVEYAPYVEFGTYKMRAQPYMQPGADAAQQRLNEFGKQMKIF